MQNNQVQNLYKYKCTLETHGVLDCAITYVSITTPDLDTFTYSEYKLPVLKYFRERKYIIRTVYDSNENCYYVYTTRKIDPRIIAIHLLANKYGLEFYANYPVLLSFAMIGIITIITIFVTLLLY